MKYSDWIEELKNEERVHRPYREKAERVEKRYLLDEKSRFNVLWSNVEIQHSAMYSKTPRPDVQRRFKDANETARTAAEVLERCLTYSLDQYDFDGVMDPVVNNFLVTGLGQAKIIYDPYFEDMPQERIPVEVFEGDETEYYLEGEKLDSEEVGTDANGSYVMRSPGEKIARQDVWCRTVPWKRFRWSPAKDYEGVWWQGEDLYLTEDQARETYDIKSSEVVPLGFSHDDKKNDSTAGKLAKVTEIWDRTHRVRFAIIEGMKRILKYKNGKVKAKDDPYNLESFWPYPKPLCANVVAGQWVPIPDYLFYQEQALELEGLTIRIDALTKHLKWRGVHDGTFEELSNLANAPDGKFLAIENYAERFGDKGLESVFAEMPLSSLVATLKWLHDARDKVKQTIFEITGLSDIVRGATNPNETLGAQQMKGQFANMRINKRQKLVQRFARDILRIKAEIIAEHFTREQLQIMTGMEISERVMEMLKSDVLRGYHIDIETDSTIIADQSQEQQNRVEAVQAVTQLVSTMAPLVAQAPQMMEIVKETALFLLGGFTAGSGLEATFEKLGNGSAPGPDPMGGTAVGGNPAPGDNVSVIR